MTTYGVLGVGALGAAIATGLCRAGRDVVLSPRGAETSARLAARFESATVAPSNQAVLDAADVVVLCLRQSDASDVARLGWRPDHTVVSAVAGVSLARLQPWVRPASAARAVPMPEVADGAGPTPVHPALPQVVDLFAPLGGVVAVATEEQYDAVFTALGTVAPFYVYLSTLSDFLFDRGLAREAAVALVARTFAGVGATLAAHDAPDFAEITRSYATPGGGNAQLTELMQDAGVFDAVRSSLEEVSRRQRGD